MKIKGILLIPHEVFEDVKKIILITMFEDDEPIFGHVNDAEDVVICSFTSRFLEDFDLLEEITAIYNVEIYIPYDEEIEVIAKY